MLLKAIILLALAAAPALSSSIKGYADTKGISRAEQLPVRAEEPKQLNVDEFQANERLEVLEQREQREEIRPPTTQIKHEAKTVATRERHTQREVDLKAPVAQAPRYETKQPAVREKATQRADELKAPVSQVRYETKSLATRERPAQRAEELKATPTAQVRYETKQPATKEFKAPVKQQLRYEARPQVVVREELNATSEQQREAQEPIETIGWGREEQRRLVEEQPALIQPVAPLSLVEETHREQFQQQQQQQQIVQQPLAIKGAAAALVQAPFVEAEPYAFSYQVDGSSRSESGDSRGVVRGQYTVQGADGASRVVDYIADANGFRATVNTNEFGTEARWPANVVLRSSQPPAEDISLRLEGKTRADLQIQQTEHTGI